MPITDTTNGNTFLLRETQAPKGFKISVADQIFTVKKNGVYVANFSDTPKNGSASLSVTKTFLLNGEAQQLSGGEFEFVLKNELGETVDVKTNNADGKVIFDDLQYTGYDLGFHRYSITETAGNDENISYDNHVAELTVLVSDSGDEELTCTINCIADSLNFTNTEKKTYPIKIDKKITGTNNYCTGAKLVLKDVAGNIKHSEWEVGDTTEEIILEPGVYILAETSVPEGYVKAPDIRFTVAYDGTVTSSTTNAVNGNTVTMYDDPEGRFTVRLKKTASDTGAAQQGAEFELSGTIENEPFSVKATTTSGGYAVFKAIPAGTFTLTETKAPENYESIEPQTVVIKTDGQIDTESTTVTVERNILTVTDEPRYNRETVDSAVRVTKVDDNDSMINGAIFTLYSDAELENAVADYTGGEFSISTTDKKIIPLLPTENNQSVTLYLKETNPPEGYQAFDSIIEIKISARVEQDDDTHIIQTTYTMTADSETSKRVPNPKITSEQHSHDSITINKTDKGSGELIDTAEFTVYSDSQCENPLKTYSTANGAITISTSETEFENYTTLYVKETKAPNGYTSDDTVYRITIEISSEETLTDGVFVTTFTYVMKINGEDSQTVTNSKNTVTDRKDAKLKAVKVDEKGRALDGATFGLYTEIECTNKIAEYTGGKFEISTSDEQLSDYLPTEGSRTFYLKETKSPKGYKIGEEVFEIIISVSAEESLHDNAYYTVTEYTIELSGKETTDIPNQKDDSDLTENNTDTQTDTDTSTESDTDTKTDTDTSTESDTDTKTDTDTSTESDTDTQTDTDTSTESDTDTQTDTETSTESDTDTKTDTDTSTESDTDKQTDTNLSTDKSSSSSGSSSTSSKNNGTVNSTPTNYSTSNNVPTDTATTGDGRVFMVLSLMIISVLSIALLSKGRIKHM